MKHKSRKIRAFVVLLTVSLCGLGAGIASAEPALVMLVTRDQPKVTGPLHEAVKAQLSDVEMRLRLQRVTSLVTGRDCRLAGAREVAGGRGVAAVLPRFPPY